jgi:hypothetical protein
MASEYDFDPRNLPQEVLAAIGLAVASSAQLEYVIQSGIAGCAGVDFEYGAAITTHMTMPLRDSVLRSVAEIRIENLDDLDTLDDHLDKVDEALKRRNALVHHSWLRDPKTGAIYTLKEVARTRYEMDLIPMSIDKIKEDALFIYDVGANLYDFFVARGLLPAVPSASRPRHHKSKAARKKRRKAMGLS